MISTLERAAVCDVGGLDGVATARVSGVAAGRATRRVTRAPTPARLASGRSPAYSAHGNSGARASGCEAGGRTRRRHAANSKVSRRTAKGRSDGHLDRRAREGAAQPPVVALWRGPRRAAVSCAQYRQCHVSSIALRVGARDAATTSDSSALPAAYRAA